MIRFGNSAADSVSIIWKQYPIENSIDTSLLPSRMVAKFLARLGIFDSFGGLFPAVEFAMRPFRLI